MITTTPQPQSSKPWWKFPIVWMVIAGPAFVVVAGVVTVMLALGNPDPVLETSRSASSPSEAPAVQGRNRAAENAVKPAESR
jgi:uncharacterized protein